MSIVVILFSLGEGGRFFNFWIVLSIFYFLLIEVHCTFSISYTVITYVYYYCIFSLQGEVDGLYV